MEAGVIYSKLCSQQASDYLGRAGGCVCSERSEIIRKIAQLIRISAPLTPVVEVIISLSYCLTKTVSVMHNRGQGRETARVLTEDAPKRADAQRRTERYDGRFSLAG